MPYTPPSCGSVNYNLGGVYTPPICSAVNFSVSENAGVELLAATSIIHLFSDIFQITESIVISTNLTNINLYVTSCPLDVLTDLRVAPTQIVIASDACSLQRLPDMICSETTLHLYSDTYEMVAGREQDLPTKLSTGGMLVKWGENQFADEFQEMLWGDAIPADKFTRIEPIYFEDADISVDVPFGVLEPSDEFTVIPFDKLYPTDYDTSMSWITMFITDDHRKIVYGGKYEISNPFVIPYRAPPPKDASKTFHYGGFVWAVQTKFISWIVPGQKDILHRVPWGPIDYFSFCSTRYYGNDTGIVNFILEPQDPSMVGACYKVTFDTRGMNTDPRCPYIHQRSGRRDPYIDGIIIPIVYPPLSKETYYMMNIITVRTVQAIPVDIEATSISIKYDKQSWLWQFQLTIGKDHHNYLDFIKPDSGNIDIFTDIEITINGWKWICRVESYTESRIFPKDSWVITGRSPSMELGFPTNQKTSHVYTSTGLTSGGQIIDDVLEGATLLGIPNTGWTMDWTAYGDVWTGFDPMSASQTDGWGIPSETFSWKDQTQIEVVKQLVDSIGGFIITTPNCKTDKRLIVKPKYNIPPWHWNKSPIDPFNPTLDHIILSSYMTEVGRSYESLPTYNAVYVLGQSSVEPQNGNTNSGVPVVNLYRDGFSPGTRIYASDIINPWVTTWKSGCELGRMTLCETGSWLRHTLNLFSIAQFGDLAPTISGLILPGEYIRVEEKSYHWYGSVSSVDITANVVNKSVFAVYQTIEVEEFLGD